MQQLLYLSLILVSSVFSSQTEVAVIPYYAKIYSVPAESGSVRSVVEAGAQIQIGDCNDSGWCKVIRNNAHAGYISTMSLPPKYHRTRSITSASTPNYLMYGLIGLLFLIPLIWWILKKKGKLKKPILSSEHNTTAEHSAMVKSEPGVKKKSRNRSPRQGVLNLNESASAKELPVTEQELCVFIATSEMPLLENHLGLPEKYLDECFLEIGFQSHSYEAFNSLMVKEAKALYHDNNLIFLIDCLNLSRAGDTVLQVDRALKSAGMPSGCPVVFLNLPPNFSKPSLSYLSDVRFIHAQKDESYFLQIAADFLQQKQKEQSEYVLHGRLIKDSLLEILQLLELGGREGVLRIYDVRKELSAVVGLKDGKIVLARSRKNSGKEAVLEMLSRNSGEFSFEERQVKGGDLLLVPTTVMMEYVQKMDEGKNNMNIRNLVVSLVFSVFLTLFGGCSREDTQGSSPESQLLFRAHGSNTIGAKLMPELVKQYLTEIGVTEIRVDTLSTKLEKKIYGKKGGNTLYIEVFSYGSSTGFDDLAWKKCDIAMSSRPIDSTNVEKLRKLGDMTRPESEHILALDGIAVVVHPGNPLEKMAIADLKKIYQGEITHWEQFNSDVRGPIRFFRRDANSGTHEVFKSMVMKKEDISGHAGICMSNREVSQNVSADSLALGYASSTFIGTNKPLAVYNEGAIPLYPAVLSIQTEEYPLSRRLYLYTASRPENSHVRKFIRFALSQAGQLTVEKAGFIPQIVTLQKPKLHPEWPGEYRAAIQGALRMNLNFRFIPGTDRLDHRSENHVGRLVQFIRNEKLEFCRLRLIGFSDNIGNTESNKVLSHQRAAAVGRLIEHQLGPRVETILGMGEAMPVADNASWRGRSANRRVEIWMNCPEMH